jgi:hypothetical protein
MRTLVGSGLSLLLASGLLAQYRGGPRFTIPGAVTDPTFAARLGRTVAGQGVRRRPPVPGTSRPWTVITYAYPVYVGGYFEDAYPAEPVPQEPPGNTMSCPSQPVPENTEVVGSDDAQDPTTPTASAVEFRPVEEPASTNEPSHYLIAYKDHTIYSAVAYWVDGDTLNYFTSANSHNQVSLSLIDRDLTERLNQESGLEVKLPAAK